MTGPGTVRVIDSITCDRVAQINSSKRRVEVLDPSGAVSRTHEYEFQLRYVWIPEMELLLRAAGFTCWRVRSLFRSIHEAADREVSDRIEEGDMLAWSAWRERAR